MWDGAYWTSKGKEFCSPAKVIRSLHENGEVLQGVEVVFTGEEDNR